MAKDSGMGIVTDSAKQVFDELVAIDALLKGGKPDMDKLADGVKRAMAAAETVRKEAQTLEDQVSRPGACVVHIHVHTKD